MHHTVNLIILVMVMSWPAPVDSITLETPVERNRFMRISTSEEMSAYLDTIAAKSSLARKEVIGYSVTGRPLEALILSIGNQRRQQTEADSRLTLVLVGSQHGAAEPAGGEALLTIVRELTFGGLRPLLADIDIVVVPNANPDGRDNGHRSNANGVNINTDFVLAMQPETQALERALVRYSPEVVLDSHESAVLKKQSLAREGYLTDFEAQFEIANNPAIGEDILRFMSRKLLPELLVRVRSAGLPARRYIGEITSIRQPITNGGLTVRNFRNTAGMSGAVSFLVETKLDSREDRFSTYRNIGPRIERQLVCLRSFIRLVYEHRLAILRNVANNRIKVRRQPIPLYAHYVRNLSHPEVVIPLRRIDSRTLQNLNFSDHRSLELADVITMPKALIVVKHIGLFKALLDRHGFKYRILATPLATDAVAMRYRIETEIQRRTKMLESSVKPMTFPVGALYIDLAQSDGRLIVLLLDPRSISSVFRYSEFAKLMEPESEHFIYPIVDPIESGLSD